MKKTMLIATILLILTPLHGLNFFPINGCYVQAAFGDSSKNLALRFLENVIGLRIDAYDIHFKNVKSGISEISGHIETKLDIRLHREGWEIYTIMVLVDGKLSFYDLERTPEVPVLLGYSERGYLNIARKALQKYQLCFGKPYCVTFTKMLGMLETVSDGGYDLVNNFYGSDTTPSNIYYAASGADRPYSIVFHIGHGENVSLDGETHWLIYDNYGAKVYDKDIWQYSFNRYVKFAFLWSCQQGDLIGGNYSSDNPYGMPYAWLHTTILSSDGYTNPDGGGYAFIGFNGSAPYLSVKLDGKANASYYFLLYFYDSVLYPPASSSIRISLETASSALWGKYFKDCIFRTEYAMKVYGDGGMHIGSDSGGGGCPFIYVWNGTDYVVDNNVLPAAEDSNGIDVEDYYRLGQLIVPTSQGTLYSIYSLQIGEFGREHDYLDQVKLLAVDHSFDTNVAVSPYGEILTYGNPISPTSAVDDHGTDTLWLLSAADGNYYQGHNGSYIIVSFATVDVSNSVKLVVREDGPVRKCPIYIQILNTSGCWKTVAVFYTRHYWTTDIINMTGYLPDAEGKLRVRLYFVDEDRIDYVGLDTSAQAEIQIHNAYLVSAIHSEQGPITLKLLFNDQTYAELLPGQHIKLIFIVSTQQTQTRTFILYSEGHYHTITS